MTPDSIEFVDKDNARSLFLCLLKHIAHSRRADTDKHLDKIRAGNREKRDLGFTRYCLGQKRLARSRRTHHQHALRDLAPEPLKLARVLQKIDNLGNLSFGFFNASDVGERDPDLVFTE